VKTQQALNVFILSWVDTCTFLSNSFHHSTRK